MVYETKKFDKHNVENPGQIFSDTKVYHVPYSQRNFSWNTIYDDITKNQVGKFWNALLRQWQKYREFNNNNITLRGEIDTGKSANDGHTLSTEEIEEKRNELDRSSPNKIAEYFIGPMVFSKSKRGENQFNIVDGQQRLSTLTMIFAICRDIYFEIREDEYIKNDKIEYSRIQSTLLELLEINNSSTSWVSEGKWRLQPNNQDLYLFNNIILPWDITQHKNKNNNSPEIFRKNKPNAKCLRLEEKIKYFSEEIKDSERKEKYFGKESNLKIIRTYLTLEEAIWTGVVTNFLLDTDEQDKIIQKIKDNAEIETDFQLHNNPKDFELSENFFTNDDHTASFDKLGLDVIQKRYYDISTKTYEKKDWSEDVEAMIENKFKKLNKIGESDPNYHEKFEKWLDEFILKKKKKGLRYLQTTLTKNDNFEKIFAEKKAEEYNRLRKEQAIQNIEKNVLDEFIANMLQNLLFAVRMTLEETKTANLVFKTLNYEGEPLTTADLIKNHILDHIRDDQDKKDLAINWDSIISKIKKPDDFLELSLKSRGVKYDGVWEFDKFKVADLKTAVKVTDDTLYDILEQKISNERDAKNYVDELQQDVEIYLKLQDYRSLESESRIQYEKHEEIGPALEILNNLGYVYANIPIMAAWRHWGSLNGTMWKNSDLSFVVLIKILAIWLFRFKTIRNNPGAASTIESVMTKITKYIKNNSGDTPVQRIKIITNIQKFLLTYDDDGDFLYNLKRTALKKSSSDIDVVILSQITKSLPPTQRELYGFDSLQRDHILPQNNEKWIAGDFVSDWSRIAKENGNENEKRMHEIVSYFDNESIPTDEHDFKNMVDVLGNLTLVTGKMNIAVSNLPFLDKKFHFNSKHDMTFLVSAKNCDSSKCEYFSNTKLSTKEYHDSHGHAIPIGSKTYCPKHAEQDGYSGSELSITSLTVMKNETSGIDRTTWTALSIMERTRFFVEKTYDLWRLPKIYCTNPNCVKHQNHITPVKGDDLNETNEDSDNFIGNKKCTEEIDGQSCNYELEVLWPVAGLAPDLDVPSGNNKPNSSRMLIT